MEELPAFIIDSLKREKVDENVDGDRPFLQLELPVYEPVKENKQKTEETHSTVIVIDICGNNEDDIIS